MNHRPDTPCADPAEVRGELDRLVRREFGRLVAELTARLGGARLDLAEDVAQEALIRAMAVWPYQGLPRHPRAWLARVARNLAIDRLRRERREVPVESDTGDPAGDTAGSLFASRVPDPELRLMLLCCTPELNAADRVALTLRVACGFSNREIARLLLLPEGTLGQRLARAKRRLRSGGQGLEETPSPFEIRSRAASVRKTIYLAFSLAYAPAEGDRLVRRDMALEAVRLARELAGCDLTQSPEAAALAALLCFQASRLEVREDEHGLPVLLADQDRERWDHELIAEGFAWLGAARRDGAVSRYHLEAGIAAMHAAAPDWSQTDWSAMLRLYRLLQARVDSPVIAVNRAVAEAQSGNLSAALRQLRDLAGDSRLTGHAPYHVARAAVLRLAGQADAAAAAYREAIACGTSQPVRFHLESMLAGLAE